MRRIDFVIVGAQKSGSTSLHRYLAAHPGVFLPAQKELNFFVDEQAYRAGLGALGHHFRGLGREAAVGLGHVGMMFGDGAARRAREHNPDMRIVAVLREPVSRAYSAYWQHRRMRWDDSPTFEEALARESRGELPAGAAGAAMAYRRNGCYLERLQPYIERFGRDRLFLAGTRELETDPAAVVSAIARWLGAGEAAFVLPGERHNRAAMPRWPWLQRLLLTPDSRIKRAWRRRVPEALRAPLRQGISRRLLRWNERPFDYPPMAPATREELQAFYAPHNVRLAQWLGKGTDLF